MPNTAGLNTSLVAAVTTLKRSFNVSSRPCLCCARPSCLKQFSTTITAPSTIKPKSIAPKLIRLPDTRLPTMPVTANNILSGITIAVISAPVTLPNNSSKITITSTAPSNRLVFTVAMVLSTRVVRS